MHAHQKKAEVWTACHTIRPDLTCTSQICWPLHPDQLGKKCKRRAHLHIGFHSCRARQIRLCHSNRISLLPIRCLSIRMTAAL